MITSKGTYTATCPECSTARIVHVIDSEGSIGPNMCSQCKAKFKGIDRGTQPNSYYFAGIIQGADESDRKVGINAILKEPSEKKSFTLKTSKKSSVKDEETKKTDKKSSGKKEEPTKTESTSTPVTAIPVPRPHAKKKASSTGKDEVTKKTEKKSSESQSFTLNVGKKASGKDEEAKETSKKSSFKWS